MAKPNCNNLLTKKLVPNENANENAKVPISMTILETSITTVKYKFE